MISEYNPKRRRYIGDRRQLVAAQKAELQKALFERIHEGDVVDGIVKNVTDFGAFVDLGGADGLLHIAPWKSETHEAVHPRRAPAQQTHQSPSFSPPYR